MLLTVRPGCAEYEDMLSESLEGSRVSLKLERPGKLISRARDLGCLPASVSPFSDSIFEFSSSERVSPPRALIVDTTGSKTRGLFSTGFILAGLVELLSVFSTAGAGLDVTEAVSSAPNDATLGLLLCCALPSDIPSPVPTSSPMSFGSPVSDGGFETVEGSGDFEDEVSDSTLL